MNIYNVPQLNRADRIDGLHGFLNRLLNQELVKVHDVVPGFVKLDLLHQHDSVVFLLAVDQVSEVLQAVAGEGDFSTGQQLSECVAEVVEIVPNFGHIKDWRDFVRLLTYDVDDIMGSEMLESYAEIREEHPKAETVDLVLIGFFQSLRISVSASGRLPRDVLGLDRKIVMRLQRHEQDLA